MPTTRACQKNFYSYFTQKRCYFNIYFLMLYIAVNWKSVAFVLYCRQTNNFKILIRI